MGSTTWRRVGLFAFHMRQRNNSLSRFFCRWDEKLTPENLAFMQEVIHENYTNKDSPLKEGPWKHGEYTTNPETIRSGVLGLKLGTLPQWDKKGRKFYVTLVQVKFCLAKNYEPIDLPSRV